MKRYDIIIVGAGPGGLKCAEILSQQHRKVLILEKNEEIGPKVCAGGITRKSFDFLQAPSSLMSQSFDSLLFRNFKHKTKLFFGEKFLYTVDRRKLGQWQLGKLSHSSVDIRTEAMVSEINPEYVVINKTEKIGYSFLVGADGSNSIVRRYLGLPTKKIGVAFQYLLPKKKQYQDIELFFDAKLFGAWYSWIFPHKDFDSIGFGCFPKLMSIQKARRNFEEWVQKRGIDMSGGKFEAHPINCDYRGHQFGKVFLIGDAAGLASGLTGEGIYQALASGHDVAKKILDSKHDMKLIAEIIRERRIHHIMLFLIILTGPLRNFVFWAVIMSMRSRVLSRFLLRILT